MSANKGGPAFPVDEIDQVTHQLYVQHMGMTLRDYFAAKAMHLVEREWDTSHDDQRLAIAQLAYRIADAMLKARGEG